jgi:hypothetical protein
LYLCLTKYYAMKTYALIKRHAMNTYGVLGIAPRILNLGTSWKWVVSFALYPLYPR